MGVSTIHGAESFYEFLRPSHREKRHLFAMKCLYVRKHKNLKRKLQDKLGKDKVGEMFVLLLL